MRNGAAGGAPLNPVEIEVMNLFKQLSRALGQRPSIAEIYGLLFVSAQPLTMDDLTARLRLSNGSASQGLKYLRDLGAVRVVEVPGARRTHYEAVAELRNLAGNFLHQAVSTHLSDSGARLERIAENAQSLTGESRKHALARIKLLQSCPRRRRAFAQCSSFGFGVGSVRLGSRDRHLRVRSEPEITTVAAGRFGQDALAPAIVPDGAVAGAEERLHPGIGRGVLRRQGLHVSRQWRMASDQPCRSLCRAAIEVPANHQPAWHVDAVVNALSRIQKARRLVSLPKARPSGRPGPPRHLAPGSGRVPRTGLDATGGHYPEWSVYSTHRAR